MASQRDERMEVSALLRAGIEMSEVANLVRVSRTTVYAIQTYWQFSKECCGSRQLADAHQSCPLTSMRQHARRLEIEDKASNVQYPNITALEASVDRERMAMSMVYVVKTCKTFRHRLEVIIDADGVRELLQPILESLNREFVIDVHRRRLYLRGSLRQRRMIDPRLKFKEDEDTSTDSPSYDGSRKEITRNDIIVRGKYLVATVFDPLADEEEHPDELQRNNSNEGAETKKKDKYIPGILMWGVLNGTLLLVLVYCISVLREYCRERPPQQVEVEEDDLEILEDLEEEQIPLIHFPGGVDWQHNDEQHEEGERVDDEREDDERVDDERVDDEREDDERVDDEREEEEVVEGEEAEEEVKRFLPVREENGAEADEEAEIQFHGSEALNKLQVKTVEEETVEEETVEEETVEEKEEEAVEEKEEEAVEEKEEEAVEEEEEEVLEKEEAVEEKKVVEKMEEKVGEKKMDEEEV
ncbi:hypothetical protein FHG87_005115 [Trinorchestia longiramus]|nr:hypothetical protein FHG87_005115 [Trinorchestia longiramus]